jgi:hypothetical protein
MRRGDHRDCDRARVSYRAYQRTPNGAFGAFPGFKQMCEHRVSRVVEFNLSDIYPGWNSVRVSLALWIGNESISGSLTDSACALCVSCSSVARLPTEWRVRP